jgi:hypothetical protein
MKILSYVAGALALALLSSCGGGAGVVDGSALDRPVATATIDTCVAATNGASADVVGYQMVSSGCVKTFEPLAAGYRLMAQTGSTFTWSTLIVWAEKTYPQYFAGTSQSGTYLDYTYVYYPATGNYIAMRNTDMVYVFGPIFDNNLLYVGTLGSLSSQAGVATSTPTAVTLTSDQSAFLSWAQGKYPQLFNGSSQDASDGTYTYRHYPTTGNYLMFAGGRVYLRGPAAGAGSTQDLGLASGFTCQVTPTAAGCATTLPGGTSTSTSTVSAPAPINTARSISVGTSVPLAGTGTEYFAVQLTAGVLYSFNNGTPPLTDNGGSLVYDSAGKAISFGWKFQRGGYASNPFHWTPPATGVYYILPGKSGTALLIRSHGSATTNPYTADAGWTTGDPVWLITSRTVTFDYGQVSMPAGLLPINLHAGETVRLKLSHSGLVPVVATVVSGSGQVLKSATVGYREKVTMNVSAPTSDTYYLQLRKSKADAGAIVAAAPEFLADTDGDGDPDETDPYPSDPKRYSTTTTGTGNGGGATSGGSCGLENYQGPQDDPQTWTICAAAYSHKCNGDSTSATRMCTHLTGVLRAYGNSSTAGQYCSAYCQ